MNDFPWVILGLIVGLILLGVLVTVIWKKKKAGELRDTNYRVIYILGLVFLPLGIIYEVVFFVSGTKVILVLGIAFVGMWLSYLAIGLGNRGKWRK